MSAADILARSPLGRQVLAEHEAARTAARSAILSGMHSELSALSATEAEARTEALKLDAQVGKAYAAFVALSGQLAEAQRVALNASMARETRQGRTRRELADLGQTAIDRTRRELAHVVVAELANLGETPERDAAGRPTGTRQRNPEAHARHAAARRHLAELDRLELSDTAPSVIEAHCSAMLKECVTDSSARPAVPPVAVASDTGSVARRVR